MGISLPRPDVGSRTQQCGAAFVQSRGGGSSADRRMNLCDLFVLH